MEEKDHYITQLEKENSFLKKKVSELEDKLENLLGKHSGNSSIPTSKENFAKRIKKSLRKPSSKKVGGQKGHPGKTLEMVGSPDIVEEIIPSNCKLCGKTLIGSPVIATEKRQLFDLPPVTMQVTEFCAHTLQCQCGNHQKGTFPEEVTAPVQYGSRLMALGHLISTFHCVADKRVCDLLSAMTGYRPNESTLYNSRKKLYNQLAQAEDCIKTAIFESPVVHADETGLKVSGEQFYTHVASTNSYTAYHVSQTRGSAAVVEMDILPTFNHTVVSDCFTMYDWMGGRNAKCNAHLLRDLEWVKEKEDSPPWATAIQKLLLTTKKKIEEQLSKGKTALSRQQLRAISMEWDNRCKEGLSGYPKVKGKKPPGHALLNRLVKRKDEFLLFAHDFTVPFDNNQAERDLRMLKTKQKVSGCMRTKSGAQQFLRIRGYLSTLQKHGLDLLENLMLAFSGKHWVPKF